ncbi:MAG: ThiF family adenylyltransferase [Bacilli bacterium]
MSKQIIDDFDGRTKLLLGEKFDKIKEFKFVICGVGGVGSIIPLTLVRTGVKNITIIDFDKVDASNLNRQIAYDKNDIGLLKVDALENKINLLRDDVKVNKIEKQIDNNFDFSIFDDADYVFDCIDDIPAKISLIKYCYEHKIKIISSLGMGNRLNPSKIIISTLDKTYGDPLAKKIRTLLKKENVDISKIVVSFSYEKPIIKDRIISSIAFVPNESGLLMTSFVLCELLEIKEEQ